MLEAILVFVLGLTPSVLSVWMMRRAKEQAQVRLRAALHTSMTMTVQRNQPLPPDQYYLEDVGYLIGDISCRFNACSAHIRCAVNPSGPCEDCHYYEPKD